MNRQLGTFSTYQNCTTTYDQKSKEKKEVHRISSSSSSNGLPFEHLAHKEFNQPQSVAHFA
jgi:hypothetical protein